MLKTDQSLYTLSEAAAVIAEQFESKFTVYDLVYLALDGAIYFSILMEEDFLFSIVEKHWEKPSDRDAVIAEIQESAERHPTGKLIVYVPTDNDYYAQYRDLEAYGAFTSAIPVSEVIIQPTPSATHIPLYIDGIKLNGKPTGFMGALFTDQNVLLDDYSHFFNDRIEYISTEILYTTTAQLDSLIDKLEKGGIEHKDLEPFASKWQDVTIRLLANHRVSFSCDDGNRSTNMHDLGLIDKRDNSTPNKAGGVLIGLAQHKKYPNGTRPTEAEKQAMKKLRKLLNEFTGMTGNPFKPPNPRRPETDQ